MIARRLSHVHWSACFIAGAVLFAFVGCNEAPAPPAEPTTGLEVLERTIAAYQKAVTYADSGEVHFRFKDGEKLFDETYPWSVSVVRPNKLRMHVYAANAVCDGKNLWATLADLPGQVLKRPAPPVLSQDAIYENPTLYDQMLARVAGGPVILMFLLDPNALQLLLFESDPPKLLEASTVDDAPCYRVAIHRKDGDLIFWIDKVGYEVRRIDFPIVELAENLRQDGVNLSDLSLVANLKGAQLGAKIDDVAFRFEAPADARIVQDFNLMPKPLPPSQLLGSHIGDFRFTTLDGQTVTRESLAGKVVVVDFWATWCVPCLQVLPQLQKVYDRFKDDSRIEFVAVSIDRPEGSSSGVKAVSGDSTADVPTVGNEVVRATLTKVGVSIPILRDPDQQAKTIFDVAEIPNIFVLGPDGTVEDQELGANPAMADELPGRLERLLAGGSLVAESRHRYEERMRQYEAQFQGSANTGGDPALQRGAVAPASQPEHLKLSRLWSSTELQNPGNILVVGDGDATRIFVVENLTSVVEVGLDGKMVARHALDLPKQPEEGIVAFLRTAVSSDGNDGDGKRWFVGGATNRQQLHVFDSDWKRTLSYPEDPSAAGIADAQFGDLDGDGQPEINIGFFELVGVQNVSLDGHRRWGNRTLANVMSIAVTDPDAQGHRRLLCTNERGTLVPLDYEGHEQTPMSVGGRFIRSIHATDVDDKQEFLAIATTAPGADSAVAIDATGRERWSMQLPPGLQPIPSVEPITSGDLAGSGKAQWVVLGSDASITVVNIDGKLVDHWCYGTAVSGIAVAPNRRLLIATADGVQMWQAE
jgi:thiol-disulfide isomerase/thioredoxin